MARRAYHELNLDISELHNEVKQGTLDIPLHSFTQYLNTVLFPNAQNEKFNQNGDAFTPLTQSNLRRLRKLMRNPDFTQIAVRAMEKQPNCTTRDKSRIASFLTAIFADDPAYLTKLTFILTGYFLREKAAGRSPKLAFRWAEAVAEKLLGHWLHLSLFHYIQGESGKVFQNIFYKYREINI